MQVKETLAVFVSPHSSMTPAEINSPAGLHRLSFMDPTSENKYFIEQGYTQVGTAEVIFTPLAMEDMVGNKVDALRKQAESIRAEATAKVTKIEGQIQNLLAIGFDEKSVFQKASDEDYIPF